MRLCSRKRPTMLVTSMFSLMPGIPGRRQHDAAHEKVHFHPRLRSLVKQADDLRIHQGVHLENQPALAAIALMLDLAPDHGLELFAHGDRGNQQFLEIASWRSSRSSS